MLAAACEYADVNVQRMRWKSVDERVSVSEFHLERAAGFDEGTFALEESKAENAVNARCFASVQGAFRHCHFEADPLWWTVADWTSGGLTHPPLEFHG